MVLFNAGYTKDFAFAYYAQRGDLRYRGFPEKYSAVNDKNKDQLREIVKNEKRVFLVRSMSLDHERTLEKELGRYFSKLKYYKFYKVEVFLFET